MSNPEISDIMNEIRSSVFKLSNISPGRLERWWKALVGAPPSIYLQLSCEQVLQHVEAAYNAVNLMIDLLGTDQFPVALQESVQRYIAVFEWHVSGDEESGTHFFEARWDKDTKKWALSIPYSSETRKLVPTLYDAVEKANEWGTELDSKKSGG